MSYKLASVVLPVYRQADHVADIVAGLVDALERLPGSYELVLVPNGPDDGTAAACRALACDVPGTLVVPSSPGWGEAVRAGLCAAGGDLLCYTNSARTSPGDLALVLLHAQAYPGTVVKAKRPMRDNWRRQMGSALYNLECRALFGLSASDVNGTPKAFPRGFDRLLGLDRGDDLIDLEFQVVCRREGYPLAEVPIRSTRRHSGSSTTGYRSALRMYGGAFQMWRTSRKAGADHSRG